MRALRSVFAQLSGRLVGFVDLHAEAVEQGQSERLPDLMRLHALWAGTGNCRLGRKRPEYGVMPQGTAAIH